MNRIIQTFSHYLTIYRHLFLFKFKSAMSYRINFFLKLFYGPAYIGVMFLITNLAFSQTGYLAGWSKSEGLLLFSVFQLIYINCFVLFLTGFRHFLWQGVRHGEIDLMLVKPVNTQFLVAFSYPDIDQILLWFSLAIMFIYQLLFSTLYFSMLQFLSFGVMFIIAHLIIYFVISTYAPLGFYLTKAQQVMEIFDKSSDFAQYPTPLFPSSIRWIFFTILPTAFFGYLPTSFLIGKGNYLFILVSLLFLIFLIGLNKITWQKGLRNYSSVSS